MINPINPEVINQLGMGNWTSVDTMILMALQIPPHAKSAGIESAHASDQIRSDQIRSDQNTSYVIFDSGKFNSWTIQEKCLPNVC